MAIVITFWNVMKTLLNTIFVCRRNVPRTTSIGLADEIINAAKEQISKEDESFEDVIADLEQSRVTIEKEQQEIAEYKERIRTLQEQLQKKNEKIDQAKGAAKEGVGKLTGDKKIEKEGAAEKAAAKVKEVAEDVKDAIEGTIDGVKNIINKDKK